MNVQRGDVVFLRFPFSDGSGSKMRPAVVVQSNRDNLRMESTIVVLITGNTRLVGKEPGHILIDLNTPEGKASGLKYTSVVNTHSLFTLKRTLIDEVIGEMSPNLMMQIDTELRDCLELSQEENL